MAGGGVVLYSCPVPGIAWQMAATKAERERLAPRKPRCGAVWFASPTLMV